jgi:hypothetical protein
LAGRTVFRRETPAGRSFSVAFHLGRRVWRVKAGVDDRIYEAPRLREAVADAFGDAEDAPWIAALEQEVAAAAGVSSDLPPRR